MMQNKKLWLTIMMLFTLLLGLAYLIFPTLVPIIVLRIVGIGLLFDSLHYMMKIKLCLMREKRNTNNTF